MANVDAIMSVWIDYDLNGSVSLVSFIRNKKKNEDCTNILENKRLRNFCLVLPSKLR